MRRKRGNLFVISAPSGAGKTTLCQKLKEIVPDVKFSVSYTTRKPRAGEIDGIHYTFVDEDEFRAMIADGEFVEWAQVHGNFYGTSKRRIENTISEGFDILLDIDVQGARQIREHFSDSILIFILPPSMDELKKRLAGRMSDSPEVIARRLKNAIDEIREYKNYDYVIINDVFDDALEEMVAIIIAERVRTSKIEEAWIKENFIKEE
ncbi:guanylate kinase [Dissulfurispira thermophila]|uniref:Guanylate kinase n=2 Tax=root TaxID=1 RepID=A0A7G1H637_9BACT|nr:guanylate kinase [Dissulfurispira thermophila]BCB97207.1 guanylate kinase [Dissulfurispira thermophila]